MSINRRSILTASVASLIPSRAPAASGSGPAAMMARLDDVGATFSAVPDHPGWYSVHLPAAALGTPMRFGVCTDASFHSDPDLARMIEERLRTATPSNPLE